MGMIQKSLSHLIVTSLVIGGLKHKGAISIHPSAIKDESLRYAFTQVVQLAEDAAVGTERFVGNLWSKIEDGKK